MALFGGMSNLVPESEVTEIPGWGGPKVNLQIQEASPAIQNVNSSFLLISPPASAECIGDEIVVGKMKAKLYKMEYSNDYNQTGDDNPGHWSEPIVTQISFLYSEQQQTTRMLITQHFSLDDSHVLENSTTGGESILEDNKPILYNFYLSENVGLHRNEHNARTWVINLEEDNKVNPLQLCIKVKNNLIWEEFREVFDFYKEQGVIGYDKMVANQLVNAVIGEDNERTDSKKASSESKKKTTPTSKPFAAVSNPFAVNNPGQGIFGGLSDASKSGTNTTTTTEESTFSGGLFSGLGNGAVSGLFGGSSVVATAATAATTGGGSTNKMKTDDPKITNKFLADPSRAAFNAAAEATASAEGISKKNYDIVEEAEVGNIPGWEAKVQLNALSEDQINADKYREMELFSFRTKFFRISDGEWKQRATGDCYLQAFVNDATAVDSASDSATQQCVKQCGVRFIMRQEKTQKIKSNVRITDVYGPNYTKIDMVSVPGSKFIDFKFAAIDGADDEPEQITAAVRFGGQRLNEAAMFRKIWEKSWNNINRSEDSSLQGHETTNIPCATAEQREIFGNTINGGGLDICDIKEFIQEGLIRTTGGGEGIETRLTVEEGMKRLANFMSSNGIVDDRLNQGGIDNSTTSEPTGEPQGEPDIMVSLQKSDSDIQKIISNNSEGGGMGRSNAVVLGGSSPDSVAENSVSLAESSNANNSIAAASASTVESVLQEKEASEVEISVQNKLADAASRDMIDPLNPNNTTIGNVSNVEMFGSGGSGGGLFGGGTSGLGAGGGLFGGPPQGEKKDANPFAQLANSEGSGLFGGANTAAGGGIFGNMPAPQQGGGGFFGGLGGGVSSNTATTSTGTTTGGGGSTTIPAGPSLQNSVFSSEEARAAFIKNAEQTATAAGVSKNQYDVVQEEEVTNMAGVTINKKVELKELVQEDIQWLYNGRSKLYRYHEGEYKERAIGQLRVRFDKEYDVFIVSLNQDKSGKLKASFAITNHGEECKPTFQDKEVPDKENGGMKLGPCKIINMLVGDNSDEEPQAQMFAFKFGNTDKASEFKLLIESIKTNRKVPTGWLLPSNTVAIPSGINAGENWALFKDKEAEILGGVNGTNDGVTGAGKKTEATSSEIGLVKTASSPKQSPKTESPSLESPKWSPQAKSPQKTETPKQGGGGSIFGASGITPSTPTGGLFGGLGAKEESPAKTGGLFGIPPASDSSSKGLFGGGGGLFGGTTPATTGLSTAPATTTGLFGGLESGASTTTDNKKESEKKKEAPLAHTIFSTSAARKAFIENAQKTATAAGVSKSQYDTVNDDEVAVSGFGDAKVQLKVLDMSSTPVNETELYSHRAKLFRYSEGEWKERGLGTVILSRSIERSENGNGPYENRLYCRFKQEKTGKIQSNFALTHVDVKECCVLTRQSPSFVSFLSGMDSAEDEPTHQMLAIKLKTADIVDNFTNVWNDAKKNYAFQPISDEEATKLLAEWAKNKGSESSAAQSNAASSATPGSGTVASTAPAKSTAVATTGTTAEQRGLLPPPGKMAAEPTKDAAVTGIFGTTINKVGGLFGGGSSSGGLFGGGNGGGLFGGKIEIAATTAATNGGGGLFSAPVTEKNDQDQKKDTAGPKSPTLSPKREYDPTKVMTQEEIEREEAEKEVIEWNKPSNWKPTTLLTGGNGPSGHEEEEEVYSTRCKAYRWRDGEWKDRGIGEGVIYRKKGTNNVRFCLKNDNTGRLALNFLIRGQQNLCQLQRISQEDKLRWMFYVSDNSDDVAETELIAIKHKTELDSIEWARIFEEYRDMADSDVNLKDAQGTDGNVIETIGVGTTKKNLAIDTRSEIAGCYTTMQMEVIGFITKDNKLWYEIDPDSRYSIQKEECTTTDESFKDCTRYRVIAPSDQGGESWCGWFNGTSGTIEWEDASEPLWIKDIPQSETFLEEMEREQAAVDQFGYGKIGSAGDTKNSGTCGISGFGNASSLSGTNTGNLMTANTQSNAQRFSICTPPLATNTPADTVESTKSMGGTPTDGNAGNAAGGNSLSALGQKDAGKWTCPICTCKWPQDVMKCGACEADKPGVDVEEVKRKAEEGKKAAMAAFLGSGSSAPAPVATTTTTSTEPAKSLFGGEAPKSLFGGGTPAATAAPVFGASAAPVFGAPSASIFGGATTSPRMTEAPKSLLGAAPSNTNIPPKVEPVQLQCVFGVNTDGLPDTFRKTSADTNVKASPNFGISQTSSMSPAKVDGMISQDAFKKELEDLRMELKNDIQIATLTKSPELAASNLSGESNASIKLLQEQILKSTETTRKQFLRIDSKLEALETDMIKVQSGHATTIHEVEMRLQNHISDKLQTMKTKMNSLENQITVTGTSGSSNVNSLGMFGGIAVSGNFVSKDSGGAAGSGNFVSNDRMDSRIEELQQHYNEEIKSMRDTLLKQFQNQMTQFQSSIEQKVRSEIKQEYDTKLEKMRGELESQIKNKIRTQQAYNMTNSSALPASNAFMSRVAGLQKSSRNQSQQNSRNQTPESVAIFQNSPGAASTSQRGGNGDQGFGIPISQGFGIPQSNSVFGRGLGQQGGGGRVFTPSRNYGGIPKN